MHIKKAFLLGLSVVIVLGILKYLGDAAFSLWQPLINRYLGSVSLVLQWGSGLILTLALMVAVGFAIMAINPLQKLAQQFWLVKKLQKNHWPVALVEYAGEQVLGIILENANDDYKVLIISPPAPVSGLLIFVKREKLQFTSLTVTDVLGQSTSFGIKPIFPKLGRLENTKRHSQE